MLWTRPAGNKGLCGPGLHMTVCQCSMGRVLDDVYGQQQGLHHTQPMSIVCVQMQIAAAPELQCQHPRSRQRAAHLT